MKRVIFNLVIIVFSSFTLHAIKLPGYYITHSDDTIEVTFKVPYNLFGLEPNYPIIQAGLKYYDQERKKIWVKPELAKEIGFIYKGNLIKYKALQRNLVISGPDRNPTGYVFLMAIAEGKLNLYKRYTDQVIPAGTHTVHTSITNYLLQRQNEAFFIPGRKSFIEDMIGYLKDCPDLGKKIEEKEYWYKDLEVIVRTYNSTCGQ